MLAGRAELSLPLAEWLHECNHHPSKVLAVPKVSFATFELLAWRPQPLFSHGSPCVVALAVVPAVAAVEDMEAAACEI